MLPPDPPPAMNAPPTPARRWIAVGVGLFALWQMAFLVASNVLNLVPLRTNGAEDDMPYKPFQEEGTFTSFEPFQRVADVAGAALDAYGEVTGQEQQWSLFAPGFPPHSLFTAVDMTFADGSKVQVLSGFEPTDYNSPLIRAPFVNTRRYNVEMQFTPPVLQHTADAMREAAPVVRAQTFFYFRQCQPVLVTWLRWQIAQYAKAHPGRGGPVEVVYNARYIPTPLPGEPKVWDKPVRVRPLVRWFPTKATPADELPLQVYDEAAKRWVTLLEAGGER